MLRASTKVPKSQDFRYILVSVIVACFHAMKTANLLRLLRIIFTLGLALIAYYSQGTQATKQTLADLSKVDRILTSTITYLQTM
jgi:hypothetical protein